MATIRAVFENGVFRPTEPVTLPEACEVEFEPRLVVPDRPASDVEPGEPMFISDPQLAARLFPSGHLRRSRLILILADSGILIRLFEPRDVLHAVVDQAVLTLHRQGDELAVAFQNLAEFWNVWTRPANLTA